VIRVRGPQLIASSSGYVLPHFSVGDGGQLLFLGHPCPGGVDGTPLASLAHFPFVPDLSLPEYQTLWEAGVVIDLPRGRKAHQDQGAAKPVVLLVEPHADDIGLSLGGTALLLRSIGWRLHVLTVFTVTSPTKFAWPQAANIGISAADLARVRAMETSTACRLCLGAEMHYWPYPLSLLRGYEDSFQPVAAREDLLREILTEEVERVASDIGADLICGPLGIGGHTDHLLLFEVLTRLSDAGAPVCWYQDFPYHAAVPPPAAHQALLQERNSGSPRSIQIPISEMMEQKLTLVTVYRSQFPLATRRYLHSHLSFRRQRIGLVRSDPETIWYCQGSAGERTCLGLLDDLQEREAHAFSVGGSAVPDAGEHTANIAEGGGQRRSVDSPQRRFLEQELLTRLPIAGRVLWIGLREYCDYRERLPDSEYVTLDIDESANADITADICHCPELEDACWDWILFNGVFECLEQPWDAIDEIYRLLVPGGYVLLGAPFLKRHGKTNAKDNYRDLWRITPEGVHVYLCRFHIRELHNVQDEHIYAVAQKPMTWDRPWARWRCHAIAK